MTTSGSLSFRSVLALAFVFLFSACATEVKEPPLPPPPVVVVTPPAPLPPPPSKAQTEMANGVESYENGKYKLATQQLQNALKMGLVVKEDQANAHKYLAFLNCVRGQTRQCREEFRKALSADPAFDLTPAESGHPTWGPIFRKLKTTNKK